MLILPAFNDEAVLMVCVCVCVLVVCVGGGRQEAKDGHNFTEELKMCQEMVSSRAPKPSTYTHTHTHKPWKCCTRSLESLVSQRYARPPFAKGFGQRVHRGIAFFRSIKESLAFILFL